uniref:Uncharacterized protein n=1 Tax=Plectus sambesii TaxID=2011161 RepID=A0A914W855_9BILA
MAINIVKQALLEVAESYRTQSKEDVLSAFTTTLRSAESIEANTITPAILKIRNDLVNLLTDIIRCINEETSNESIGINAFTGRISSIETAISTAASPIDLKQASTNGKKESFSTQLLEKAKVVIEVKQKLHAGLQEQMNQALREQSKAHDRLTEMLAKLSGLDFSKVNLEEMISMLQQGLKELSNLMIHWKQI